MARGCWFDGPDETGTEGDKYRSFIHGEGESNTKWRFGSPPNYGVVNKLFEDGRTQEWAPGTLEERVQRMVKTWEMEIFHKINSDDFKSMNPHKFTISLNGRTPSRLQDLVKLGGYNLLLQTSLPENLRGYNPSVETAESSHLKFTTTFPRGFALEISQVYSGPPVVVYKFRHWAFMEGPFQNHAPTGNKAEFYGIGIFEVDEEMKIVKVEFFYDPGQLIGQLINGPSLDGSHDQTSTSTTSHGCPFLK